MEDDGRALVQRLRFDAEDFLPLEYWDRVRTPKVDAADPSEPKDTSKLVAASVSSDGESASTSKLTRKLNPEEWVKAPEFVPRAHKTLQQSFNWDNDGNAGYENALFDTLSSMHDSVHTDPFSFNPAATSPFDPQPPYSSYSPIPQLPSVNNGQVSPLLPLFDVPPPPVPRGPSPLNAFIPGPSVNNNRPRLDFVPAGYSANFASINPINGPPITAIVLKKKRKRRPKRSRALNQHIDASSPTESTSGHPSDPNYDSTKSEAAWTSSTRESSLAMTRLHSASSEPDLAGQMEEQGRGSVADKSENGGYRGSCPDLSDDQLKIWDEILHNAVTAEKQMNEMLVQTMKKADSSNKLASHTEVNGTSNSTHFNSTENATAQDDKIMRTSIYELCPPHVFDALDAAVHADGISNRELRTLDKKLNDSFFPSPSMSRGESFTEASLDISLEESFTTETMVDRLRQLHERSSSQETNPAQIHRSLQQELEDLHFKPDASDRSYPPVSSGSQFHLTTYNPQNRSVKNEIYQTIKKEDLPHLQEDYFEGMHIRVNAFEDIDDLALSESECPPPSRFQQLQWALQRQKQKYVQVDNAPARVCCSIM